MSSEKGANLHAWILSGQAHDLQGDPDEVNQLDAEELRDQTDADRCVLKLFQDSLKTGRLQRAQELAACLHLERSLEGALKLTNLHK